MIKLTTRREKRRDRFSYGIVLYAICFFIAYKVLFELSYADGFYAVRHWVYGLIVIHVVGLIWCLVACLATLRPREFGSFVCAALLVAILEFLSPTSMRLHFWLHEKEYLARVAAAQPSSGGRVSIVLHSYTHYLPSMPGGYECPEEIVYDNSNDIGRIAQTGYGRAGVAKIDGHFYFRYPPCG